MAAMVPYLLGFQPSESLVLIALEGPRKRFGPVLRVDLVAAPDLVEQQADQVLHIVTLHQLSPVLLAAFSASADRADPLVTRVLGKLADNHVAVEDAFRADGRRWWSYVCDDPRCCSPAGVDYDVSASAAAAEAVLAGLAFEPDREALRAYVGRADDNQRRQVAKAVRRLRREHSPYAQKWAGWHLGDRVAAQLVESASAAAADIAWLALAVQSQPGRDSAIALLDRANAADHFELWRQVLRSVGDDLVPDVGCVAAFAAWLDGKGVLASHVVDRVLEVDPRHRLARAIAELLAQAVNPRSWAPQRAPYPGGDAPPPLAG